MRQIQPRNKRHTNELEKYMNLGINNKLIFIDSFEFVHFLLVSSVRSLTKDVLSFELRT